MTFVCNSCLTLNTLSQLVIIPITIPAINLFFPTELTSSTRKTQSPASDSISLQLFNYPRADLPAREINYTPYIPQPVIRLIHYTFATQQDSSRPKARQSENAAATVELAQTSGRE